MKHLNNDEEVLEHINSYSEIIKSNPADAYPYYKRANAYKKLGLHEQALSDFEMAINLKPDYADALYNRGNLLRELEQFEKAIND
ncbi:MAG: tetratricopeptide repeat protein [Deltaproteobacteria bacterium]|nr:tetratricopeptide repeat protein [Deltaproteobacteria bacterium]